MKKLLTILCLVLLSSYSYSQEVVTGPFLFRDGIPYHQDTNELVTGIVEWFHDNGQLFTSGLHENGEREGLWELFDKDGNLTQTEMWENGEPVE